MRLIARHTEVGPSMAVGIARRPAKHAGTEALPTPILVDELLRTLAATIDKHHIVSRQVLVGGLRRVASSYQPRSGPNPRLARCSLMEVVFQGANGGGICGWAIDSGVLGSASSIK